MSTVMIIDDQSISRMILQELIWSLDENIQVEPFSDPIKALEWAKQHTPDLILTDYKMPGMDGVEFTLWVRRIPSCMDIPVIIITCVDDKAVRYRALEAGATDFLNKPIDHHECRARCRNLLVLRQQQQIIKDKARWLEREVEDTTRKITLREQETLLRLAKAGEYRDEDTGNHVIRMARYSRLIAETLGRPAEECEVIEHAAPMHDIGKIGIPDHILLKPGKLTPQEWTIMQSHATIGYKILHDSPSCYLQTGAIIAQSHHEQFNGKGYPQGLKGHQIALAARIVTVADVYDALVSRRPYKSSWPMQRALDYLVEQKGEQFDPDCVDAFLARVTQVDNIQSMFVDEASAGS
ncbi:MAG: response regulator [Pseudomonadota bacterium]|nr:response regulator [Pseudomonadota bacterium]